VIELTLITPIHRGREVQNFVSSSKFQQTSHQTINQANR
jgi:hypothetical protein